MTTTRCTGTINWNKVWVHYPRFEFIWGDSTKYFIIIKCIFLFRFQTAYFWPSHCWAPENTDYAVYLCKRTMQNKVVFYSSCTSTKIFSDVFRLVYSYLTMRQKILQDYRKCFQESGSLYLCKQKRKQRWAYFCLTLLNCILTSLKLSGGQKKRQAGAQDSWQSREGLLGCLQALSRPGQHHGDRHQEDVQAQCHLWPRAGSGRHREDGTQPAAQGTGCSSGIDNLNRSLSIVSVNKEATFWRN